MSEYTVVQYWGIDVALDDDYQWKCANQDLEELLNLETSNLMDDYSPAKGFPENYIVAGLQKSFPGIVVKSLPEHKDFDPDKVY